MSKNVTWAINRAFLHAKGKATAPAVGTGKHDQLLAIADTVQKMWAGEPGMEWNSLYDSVELADAVSATATYALPATVDTLSKRADDPVIITDTNGGITRYTVVDPSQLDRQREAKVVAKIGRSLVFPQAFAADSPLIGGTITVPAILAVSDITSGDDIIQVDDPLWMAYAMAAEFAQNDLVKISNVPHLQDVANLLMQKMKDNNGGNMDELVRDWSPAGVEW